MTRDSDTNYLTGFGSFFETEAVSGALPQGKNSPQKPPHGLYPEQLSGSAFTMKRSENLRSWLYRKQPSAAQKPFESYTQKYWTSQIADDGQTPPNPMRWGPLKVAGDSDFVDGVRTMAANAHADGVAIHHYVFNNAMTDRYFVNTDGELVFLPVNGGILLSTELGNLKVEPLEIAVIPRGVKFKVQGLAAGTCSGYLCENLGAPLRLPELGPIGSNGLANPRDFQYPVASFEKTSGPCTVICKFQNRFWKGPQDFSPLNVVAWHGNYAPYKYDLRKFNTIGTISYDHPDPSIFTVLTSPSAVPGKGNVDFAIFPPRWLVGEDTFRPPYFHRNVMSEYMGLLQGVYDAKQDGFVPGGASLHNCMVPHGPDAETFSRELKREEKPQKVADTMAFMFESSSVFQVSPFALASAPLDKDYWKCWQGLKDNFKG